MEDLAYHWAPIHYQDIYSVDGDQSRVDYITRIDRSADGTEGGEWNLENNWDKDLKFPLRAFVYYSVVETESHYYITYSFFHPWDTRIAIDIDLEWGKKNFTLPLMKLFNNSFADRIASCGGTDSVTIPFPYPKLKGKLLRTDYEHNDMEGVLFVIRKDSDFGTLETVFAQAHGFLQTYLTAEGRERLNAREERVRPFIIKAVADEVAFASMEDNTERIITTQEAQGHGAGCFPDWGAPSPGNILDPLSFDKRHANKSPIEKLIERKSGDDHIRYIPTRGEPEEPVYEEIRVKGYTYCKYRLLNVFEEDGLWDNRSNTEIMDYDKGMLSFIGGHGNPFWAWAGDKKGLSREDVTSKIEVLCKDARNYIMDKIKSDFSADDHIASISKAVSSKLLDIIQGLLAVLSDLLEQSEKLKQAFSEQKEILETLIDKLKIELSELGEAITGYINNIAIIKNALDNLKAKLSSVWSILVTLKDKLAGIPQTIYETVREKFWKSWKWVWGWVTRSHSNSEWYSVNDKIHSNQTEAENLKYSIQVEEQNLQRITSLKAEAETASVSSQNKVSISSLELDDLNLDEINITGKIIEIKNNIKFLVSINSEECIKNLITLEPIIDLLLKSIYEEIKTLCLINTDIIDFILMHYRTLDLTDEEKYYVNKYHYPWSHNPAHLCWIYLSVKDDETKVYFSDIYRSNFFMEDTLNEPNFKFENGRSIPK